MKLIDKLQSKFPAGLFHAKWQESNFENDAVKVFELFVSCEFEVHWKPEATYSFQSQKIDKCLIWPLAGKPQNPWPMLCVSLCQLEHSKFANLIRQ